MKALVALISVLMVAGCSGSSDSSPTKPNQSNGSPTTGGAGQYKVADSLLSNAWCNEYDMQGRTLQDRFAFTEKGEVTYTQFQLENGVRKFQISEAAGTWGTNGRSSQIALNKFVFELNYVAKDPATRTERVNIKMDGQWLPFSICD